MNALLLTPDEQNIVVFHFFRNLHYRLRLQISLLAIFSGLAVQFWMSFELPGIILVLLGNLLLLTKGYDNRVTVGRYDPGADWVKSDRSKLKEIKDFDWKMKQWDRSALDVTNPLGIVLFALCAGAVGFLFWLGLVFGFATFRILAANAAVLFLPHWFTGTRSILTRPDLILKINLMETVVDQAPACLKNYSIDFFLRLAGKKVKIPGDVKFRVSAENQHPDFLGFYGQVVTNKVQGTSYPYFYVVLVAKKGFGLKKLYTAFSPPQEITREFNVQDDVEVFVLRQTTTKNSGYHTKPADAVSIFTQGLALFEKTCPSSGNTTA